MKGKKKNKDKEDYLIDIKSYRQKSSDLFERQLVYISGGAIAICLGLLQAENSIITPKNLVPFQWALGGFIVTLLLNLISHKTAIKSLDYELMGKECESDSWDRVTGYINYLSMLSVVVGLVSIFLVVTKI